MRIHNVCQGGIVKYWVAPTLGQSDLDLDPGFDNQCKTNVYSLYNWMFAWQWDAVASLIDQGFTRDGPFLARKHKFSQASLWKTKDPFTLNRFIYEILSDKVCKASTVICVHVYPYPNLYVLPVSVTHIKGMLNTGN